MPIHTPTNPAAPMHPGATAAGLVRLVLGRTRLLLPGGEVLSIEPVLNVRPEHKHNGAPGFITIAGADLPVFAIDEDLRIATAIGSSHEVCVCLANGQDRFGILCDDAGMVYQDDIKLHELPACMINADTAILSIAEINNNLYCVSDTKSLARLIDYVRVVHPPEP